MKKNTAPYCLIIIVLLSSCTQWKNLTSRDNSTSKNVVKSSKTRDVRFLDNISVTPEKSNSSNQESSVNYALSAEKRTKEREEYNAHIRNISGRNTDIEKADWLQLKYGILLDATVESLTNINLLKLIDDWWGTGYCIGGNTKDCIDCSGFARMIMQNVYNVNLPRTAQEQYNASEHINLEDLSEGDLVFFYTGGRDISHVGVYLFNNKFVHSATSGGVMVSDLNDTYWKGRFKGAGRYGGLIVNPIQKP